MAEDGVPPMFQGPEAERSGFSMKAVLVAVAVVLLGAGIAVWAGRGRGGPAVPDQPDAYAANLPISQVAMSEATNGAGGTSTFVDGVVTNTGTATVRAVTVRASFAMSDGSAPHTEVLPLALIRTREPYIDLQPVSAAPIRPGESREFRLIFESIPPSWDVQAPELRVVQTAK